MTHVDQITDDGDELTQLPFRNTNQHAREGHDQ